MPLNEQPPEPNWNPEEHDRKRNETVQSEADAKRIGSKVIAIMAHYKDFRKRLQHDALRQAQSNSKRNKVRSLVVDRIDKYCKLLAKQCEGDADMKDWYEATVPVLAELRKRFLAGKYVSEPQKDDSESKVATSIKWRKTYR